MRLREMMSTNVETIAYDNSAENAWQQMKRSRIHHLVVVRGREVGGVITDRDLGGVQGESVRRNQVVADLMSTKPVIADANMTARDAANLLRGRSIGCLPVLEKGKLIGIITVSDLLALIGRGAFRGVAKGKGPTLSRRGPRRKPVVIR